MVSEESEERTEPRDRAVWQRRRERGETWDRQENAAPLARQENGVPRAVRACRECRDHRETSDLMERKVTLDFPVNGERADQWERRELGELGEWQGSAAFVARLEAVERTGRKERSVCLDPQASQVCQALLVNQALLDPVDRPANRESREAEERLVWSGSRETEERTENLVGTGRRESAVRTD